MELATTERNVIRKNLHASCVCYVVGNTCDGGWICYQLDFQAWSFDRFEAGSDTIWQEVSTRSKMYLLRGRMHEMEMRFKFRWDIRGIEPSHLFITIFECCFHLFIPFSIIELDSDRFSKTLNFSRVRTQSVIYSAVLNGVRD